MGGETLEDPLDGQARRLALAAALTRRAALSLGAARIPVAHRPPELVALARGLAKGMATVERAHRVRLEPAYPGATAGVEQLASGPRLVLGARAIMADGRPLGVVYTTLIPGRAPQVAVAPAEASIPPGWIPL